MMQDQLRYEGQPGLRNPSLIIAWNTDAGKLGSEVADYLNSKLKSCYLGDIEPADFSPLGGVTIEDNLIQFPENKLYVSPENNLLIFKGYPPSCEWFRYINLVIDMAGKYSPIKELYTVGSMIYSGAHTTPRQLIASFNTPELKQAIEPYGTVSNLDYQTPLGHRPTINSFFLWAARERDIPGACLWIPVPFYLVNVKDPGAQSKMLDFFNYRFNLKMDFTDIDKSVSRHNEIIARARTSNPDIDEHISRLESNLTLSDSENKYLVKQMEILLKNQPGGDTPSF